MPPTRGNSGSRGGRTATAHTTCCATAAAAHPARPPSSTQGHKWLQNSIRRSIERKEKRKHRSRPQKYMANVNPSVWESRGAQPASQAAAAAAATAAACSAAGVPNSATAAAAAAAAATATYSAAVNATSGAAQTPLTATQTGRISAGALACTAQAMLPVRGTAEYAYTCHSASTMQQPLGSIGLIKVPTWPHWYPMCNSLAVPCAAVPPNAGAVGAAQAAAPTAQRALTAQQALTAAAPTAQHVEAIVPQAAPPTSLKQEHMQQYVLLAPVQLQQAGQKVQLQQAGQKVQLQQAVFGTSVEGAQCAAATAPAGSGETAAAASAAPGGAAAAAAAPAAPGGTAAAAATVPAPPDGTEPMPVPPPLVAAVAASSSGATIAAGGTADTLRADGLSSTGAVSRVEDEQACQEGGESGAVCHTEDNNNHNNIRNVTGEGGCAVMCAMAMEMKDEQTCCDALRHMYDQFRQDSYGFGLECGSELFLTDPGGHAVGENRGECGCARFVDVFDDGMSDFDYSVDDILGELSSAESIALNTTAAAGTPAATVIKQADMAVDSNTAAAAAAAGVDTEYNSSMLLNQESGGAEEDEDAVLENFHSSEDEDAMDLDMNALAADGTMWEGDQEAAAAAAAAAGSNDDVHNNYFYSAAAAAAGPMVAVAAATSAAGLPENSGNLQQEMACNYHWAAGAAKADSPSPFNDWLLQDVPSPAADDCVATAAAAAAAWRAVHAADVMAAGTAAGVVNAWDGWDPFEVLRSNAAAVV